MGVFTPDTASGKSRMVMDVKTKSQCDAKITGSNTSNIKVDPHFKLYYKDSNEQCLKNEKLKEAGKQLRV